MRRLYYNHPLEKAIYEAGYRGIEDFCNKTGISKSTIYYFLQGRTKMLTGYTVTKIAQSLNKQYEDVIKLCEVNRNEFYN